MTTPLPQRWKASFDTVVRKPEHATALEQAAATGRLGQWTKALTRVVVGACQDFGWRATARGHTLDMLPVPQSEYLSLDVVAFPDGPNQWRFPAGLFELENNASADRIAYSLWKLLCVRAQLRVVFCYRSQAVDATPLVRALTDGVVRALDAPSRARLDGETLVVVGSRGDMAAFPYGYFRWWALDAGTANFDLM